MARAEPKSASTRSRRRARKGRLADQALPPDHDRIRRGRVEDHPPLRAARLVERDQPGHAQEQRESPVGAARLHEADQARLEHLTEAVDDRDLVRREVRQGRDREAARPKRPGRVESLQGEEGQHRVAVPLGESVPDRGEPIRGERWRCSGIGVGAKLAQLGVHPANRTLEHVVTMRGLDALAETHERRSRAFGELAGGMPGGGNRRLVEEQACAVEDHGRRPGASHSLIADGLEQPPVVHRRLVVGEVLPLDEVAPGELVEHERVGVLADRDTAHEDRAVVEHAVAVTDDLDGLPRQAQNAGRPVLEVKDAVTEGEGRVPTAAAALAAVHVEVLDLAAGAGGPGPKQEDERSEQQSQ